MPCPAPSDTRDATSLMKKLAKAWKLVDELLKLIPAETMQRVA